MHHRVERAASVSMLADRRRQRPAIEIDVSNTAYCCRQGTYNSAMAAVMHRIREIGRESGTKKYGSEVRLNFFFFLLLLLLYTVLSATELNSVNRRTTGGLQQLPATDCRRVH